MHGNEVTVVSGSDKHATSTTITIDKQKVSPQQIAYRFHNQYLESFKNLDIEFDVITRTTYLEHAEKVKESYLEFYEKVRIEEKTMFSSFRPLTTNFASSQEPPGKDISEDG